MYYESKQYNTEYILIKISVTLFNYCLYYKIEAKCCPNFP